jgi:hypothetical protein
MFMLCFVLGAADIQDPEFFFCRKSPPCTLGELEGRFTRKISAMNPSNYEANKLTS